LVSGPLWQGATVAARPVAKKYLLRRVEAPLWRVLTQGALALIGFGPIAKLSRRVRSGGAYFGRALSWWKTRHRVVRWSVGSGIVFLGRLLGLGIFVLPGGVLIYGR